MTPGSQRDGYRRACEPCRRKKSKCTGERPICSFCERLDLPCEYAARGSPTTNRAARTTRNHKKSTADRIRSLESQVSSLSGLLTSGVREEFESHRNQPSAASIPRQDVSFASAPIASDKHVFSEDSPNPPQSVLRHFVEVYGIKLHLQPLPLFDLECIDNTLQVAPEYLLHSFLALMLEFSSHPFYNNNHQQASAFYGYSAEAATQQLAGQGKPTTEVIQALCMLALRNVAAGDLPRAWMSVGTAARLSTAGHMWHAQFANAVEQDKDNRCYWSIYMIESIFFPHVSQAIKTDRAYKHPPSVEPPPPLPHDLSQINALDFDDTGGTSRDVGINANAGGVISIWSQVASYLHDIRLGETQIPWLPESTYSKLNLSLLEYEAQLHRKHLMRNLFPFKRSPEDIKAYRQYWNPWLTTHLILHASLALLNHPFIHLVALRRNKGMSQSRLFLQQVVDQAIFHSGWVFWLVGIFQDLSVDISNPLIGLAVAATSTIPWLYQFGRNAKLARKASQNLAKGQRLLEHMSKTWPFLSRKLERLKELQSLAMGTQLETGTTSTMIEFPPSMIWVLLDPIIEPAGISSKNDDTSTEDATRVSIHVTTDFLHPLEDDQDESILSPFDWENSLMFQNDLLQDIYPATLVPFDLNNL
ncbi:hypothetical protein FPOA_06566 [Fusarium poae]|uniref:Zn(2)-C6 fungal-type domain-containing protein n=1 Tax=Fusarium poae TaxID=36050 RepID=A0A1B8B023_FUSPO|nr:hypothetical protein FPOA_06566 [Fusarium poae]